MSPEKPSQPMPEDGGSGDARRRRLFADLARAGDEGERPPDADVFRAEAERGIEARMAEFPDEVFAPGGTLAGTPASRENVVPFPVRRRAAWLAVAAAVLGFAGLAAWFLRAGGDATLHDGPLEVRADGSFRASVALTDDVTRTLTEIFRRRSLTLPPLSGTDPLRGGGPDDATRLSPVTPVKLLTPWPGTAVESTQPTLRWAADPDVAQCVVTLEDLSGDGGTQSSGNLPAAATSWQPPRPLARGGIYRWTVRVPPDGSAASATFRVLAPEAAADVARARRESAGSHLLLAVAYERAGLAVEAHAELAALAAAHPGSALARELAASSDRR